MRGPSTGPHRRRDPARITKYLAASRGYSELAPRAATSNWQRFGQPGRDKTLFLQTLEGGIHGADGVIVTSARGDVVPDGKAVSIFSKARDGKQNRELEGTKDWPGHSSIL